MYDNVLVFGLSVIQNNNHSYGENDQTNAAIDLTLTIVVQQKNTLNKINIYSASTLSSYSSSSSLSSYSFESLPLLSFELSYDSDSSPETKE